MEITLYSMRSCTLSQCSDLRIPSGFYYVTSLLSTSLSVCLYVSLSVCVLQELHHEMQTKQTSYYCALHVGRTLKDQCPPTDPERNVLSEMMQLLKTRWRDVWPAISQRYKHTDTQTDRQTDKHVNSGVSECVGS